MSVEGQMHTQHTAPSNTWEHEAVLDEMQTRLDHAPDTMRILRQTVEHPFGTIKAWIGATHFLTRTIERVITEMSLHVLAYNMKRVIKLLGSEAMMQAMQAQAWSANSWCALIKSLLWHLMPSFTIKASLPAT
jgi:hypothetical protein